MPANRGRGGAREGGPRRYRSAKVQAAIEVEGKPEGEGPKQYRRAEVKGFRQEEKEEKEVEEGRGNKNVEKTLEPSLTRGLVHYILIDIYRCICQ